MIDQETQQQDQAIPEITPSELDHFFESGGDLKQESKEPTESAKEEQPQENTETVASEEQAQGEDDGNTEHTHVDETQRFKAMADEERIRRKESQKQIDHLRQENEKLKEVFNQIMNQQKQEAAPSFEDDPINALKYENEQLKKQLQGIQQDTQQTRQQIEVQNKQNAFINAYRNSADQFKSQNPDFDDAYNFLLESRMKEYETAGYEPEQAEQLALEDEAAIAANHLRKGSNPAAALYKLAQQRGYKGAQNKTNVMNERIKENEQKIQTLERGLKASKSISSGGMNSKESLSLENIAEMDDDEFARFDWDKLSRMV